MKTHMFVTLVCILAVLVPLHLLAHDGDEGHDHDDDSPSARERASADRDRTDLRIMSFNIRYGTARDGENSWPGRKKHVVDTIRQFGPDLLGTQEVQHFQAEYLKKELRGYRFHGVGRDDGKTRGEYSAIFYRAGRFKKLDAGHYWLSEEPDKPGSVSWDSSMTRMVSWVLLKDQRTGRSIAFVNTHWDHRGPNARLESGKLMRKRIEQWPDDTAIIVTGDFNTTEDRQPYQALLSGDGKARRPLIDTYRAVHEQRQPDEATFGGFKGTRRGSRIDWILCTDHFSVREAAIDYSNIDGKYPSDHYPVTATLLGAEDESPPQPNDQP